MFSVSDGTQIMRKGHSKYLKIEWRKENSIK